MADQSTNAVRCDCLFCCCGGQRITQLATKVRFCEYPVMMVADAPCPREYSLRPAVHFLLCQPGVFPKTKCPFRQQPGRELQLVYRITCFRGLSHGDGDADADADR